MSGCQGSCKDNKGVCSCAYKCPGQFQGKSVQRAMVPVEVESLKDNMKLQNIEAEEAKVQQDGSLAVTFYFTEDDPDTCKQLGNSAVKVEQSSEEEQQNKKLRIKLINKKQKKKHHKHKRQRREEQLEE